MKAFELTEKKSQDLTAKLVEVDWDKKSAKVILEGVERWRGWRGRQRLSASYSTKPRTTSLLPEAKSRS